jgi:hypothetical protein
MRPVVISTFRGPSPGWAAVGEERYHSPFQYFYYLVEFRRGRRDLFVPVRNRNDFTAICEARPVCHGPFSLWPSVGLPRHHAGHAHRGAVRSPEIEARGRHPLRDAIRVVPPDLTALRGVTCLH